jgi:hypothetical protein
VNVCHQAAVAWSASGAEANDREGDYSSQGFGTLPHLAEGPIIATAPDRTAIIDARRVAETTTVRRPGGGVSEMPALLSWLVDVHEHIIAKVRRAIVRLAAAPDHGSSCWSLRSVLRRHEQQVRVLAAYTDGSQPVSLFLNHKAGVPVG